MLRPAVYKAIVKDKQQATWKVSKLTLRYINPTEMNFIPGQFINLKCPNGHYRAYSISSDFRNRGELYILVEVGHDGLGSNYVKDLNVGDEVILIGPSGKLSLQEPLPKELKFFATGTGIAPFIAMFHRLVDMDYNGKVDLFFGSRTKDELLEQDLLKVFKTQLQNFDYTFYVSKPNDTTVRDDTKIGRISDTLNNASNISKTCRYFICGHPSMVTEIKKDLQTNGVNSQQIVIERFTHSSTLNGGPARVRTLDLSDVNRTL